MKILHISDTHNKHRDLGQMPEADVLVHSGDFSMAGSDAEALDFLEWFCDLPYKHKIFIAGNHDDCMIDANLEGLPDNVHYLHNSGIAIDGVTFYGAPMLAELVDGEMRSLERYDLIPDTVDVLISHRPPLGIMDGNFNPQARRLRTIHYGSAELLDKVDIVKPKIHLFGHVHNANGIIDLYFTRFCNAALCNDRYEIDSKPVLIGRHTPYSFGDSEYETHALTHAPNLWAPPLFLE